MGEDGLDVAALVGGGESRRVVRVTCGRCRVGFDAEVQVLVLFPEDADAVLDLVEGRLNVVACPACGLETRVVHPSLTVLRPSTRTGLAFGTSEGTDTVHDRLAAHVGTWIEEEMAEVLEAAREPGEPPEEGLPRHHSPLAMLMMLRTLDEASDEVRDAFVALVVEVLDLAFWQCARRSRLSAFPDVAAERVPVRCLTPGVLSRLAERHGDPFADEYVCAIAHSLAGVPNPREAEWARLCLTLFVKSRRGERVDEAMLLDGDVLHRTISFPAAWDVMAAGLMDDELRPYSEEWFVHVDWADEAWKAMQLGLVDHGFSRLPDDDELAAECLRFWRESGPHDEGRPGFIGSTVRAMIRRGREAAAVKVLWAACAELSEAERGTELAWTIRTACEVLNEAHLRDAARKLLVRYAPRAVRLGLGPYPRAVLDNERGNALRYMGRPREALRVYDRALRTLDGSEPARTSVLRRNRGIVLRDMGRMDEAIPILREAWAERSGEVMAAINLAVAYGKVNLVDEALAVLREAAEIPLRAVQATDRMVLLLALAELRSVARAPGGYEELREAVRLAEETPALRLRAHATVLQCGARDATAPGDLLRDAEATVLAELGEGGVRNTEHALAAAALAEWHAARGRETDARRAAERLAPLIEEDLRLPWDMVWTVAKTGLLGTGRAERWEAMRRVLDALESSVVEAGDDSRLTAAWLATRSRSSGSSRTR